MAADDFSQHPGDVEAGAEPALGSAPPRRPPSSAIRPSTARPVTSRSVVMSRLQVERIDTVEGGGLSVLGLSLHNHCGVALIIFSAFFLLIGLILAVIAFSNSVRADIEEDPNRLGFLQRNRLTLRVVGPAMLVSGFVMALCGICFCALNWKVKQEEKEKEDLEYHCPLHDGQGGHFHSHSISGRGGRVSVGSALPMGISAEQYNGASSRNSFQASGGCDLCYERAKTAKSIEEYEETQKYLDTMGRDGEKGADIACFPRPLTPNNTNGDLFSLPGAANGGLPDQQQPLSLSSPTTINAPTIGENNNDEIPCNNNASNNNNNNNGCASPVGSAQYNGNNNAADGNNLGNNINNGGNHNRPTSP